MRIETNKKVFRAVNAQVVEKQFVGIEDKVPEGWYETIEAAFAACKEQPVAVEKQEPVAPVRRGRPRKE